MQVIKEGQKCLNKGIMPVKSKGFYKQSLRLKQSLRTRIKEILT